jgi:hypothetical protein
MMFKRSKHDKAVLLLLASYAGLTFTWGSPLVGAMLEERRAAEQAAWQADLCAGLASHPQWFAESYSAADYSTGQLPYYGPFYYNECLGGGH